MPLHGAREERFILSEPDAARITAAVVGAREVGKLPVCLPPREQGAVILHRRRGIGGRTHPPFDLQRSHACGEQSRDVLPDGEVGERKRIGGLFKPRAVDGVLFAAGLFAPPAVAAVAARKGREIALPRKTGAERALNKRLRFDDGGNGGNILRGRFPRKHRARKSVFFRDFRAVNVAAARLRGEVQRQFGTGVFERPPEENILQQNRVRARVVRLARGMEKRARLLLLDERVERNIDLRAADMRKSRDPFQRGKGKIFRAFARGKSRKSQIYGVRARVQRGVSRLFVPRGGKKFRHLPIVL